MTYRRLLLAVLALGAVAATAAAVILAIGARGDETPVASWRPRPHTVRGLSVVATARNGRYALRTAHGEVGFLPGVNLGATTPGHQPGELAISGAHYRRWLAEMGALGVRAVRIYTIHPPAFYAELERYNEHHADAPLYLVQGVYLPDETYPARPRGLFDPTVDRAFRAEIADSGSTRAVRIGARTRIATMSRRQRRWQTTRRRSVAI